jgi:hypothetical protein
VNFIAAVQALVDEGVDFVIIGGWSAILHGSSSVTNDLDICYSRSPDNLERVVAALTSFHPRLRVLTLSTDLGAIDLLAEVNGLGGFEEVKADSILVQAFDREVWTLDLPALIRAKRAAGRAKDLQLLPELEGLLEAGEPW